MSEVARQRSWRTRPPTDSKANGYAERAVRSVEEQIRVMKTAYQSSTRRVVDVKSAGFAWLVEHAADTLNKALVGSDGQTPWERVRGRKYGGQVFEFGQVVLSRIPGKPVGGLMTPRWVKGLWLGKLWASDEHIVTEPGGGVVRARPVKPHTDTRGTEAYLMRLLDGQMIH